MTNILYFVFVFVLPCGRGWGSSEEIGHWASPPPSPPIPPLLLFFSTLPPLNPPLGFLYASFNLYLTQHIVSLPQASQLIH